MNVLFKQDTHLPTIIGITSALLYLSLAFGSRSYGDLGLNHLLIVSSSCALMSFYLWHVLNKSGQQIGLLTLFGFAIVFRFIGGFTFPILEDDFYRYLWDGRMTWLNGTPYDVAPSSAFDDETLTDRFELILDSINYPNVTTVYGPSCQWLFALAYLISPGEIWPLKLILAIVDLILIASLLKLAKPNSVLLYAWSPLVIKEFVITVHPDILGALFVVLTLLTLQHKRMIMVGGFLALAAGVKVFALILVPFILQFNLRAWLSFITTAILVAFPFGLLQAWVPGGLSAMGDTWLFNAPVYFIFGQIFAISYIKLSLLCVLAVGCGIYFWRLIIIPKLHGSGTDVASPPLIRGDLLFACLFLCAPVMNAWYFAWLLPFAVIRPTVWAWLASITILLSYASGLNLTNSSLEAYALSPWVIAIEYVPPLLAFMAAPYLTRYYNSIKNL